MLTKTLKLLVVAGAVSLSFTPAYAGPHDRGGHDGGGYDRSGGYDDVGRGGHYRDDYGQYEIPPHHGEQSRHHNRVDYDRYNPNYDDYDQYYDRYYGRPHSSHRYRSGTFLGIHFGNGQGHRRRHY